MTPHPSDCARRQASMDSVMDPIWLTFNNSPLQAFFSIAL